MERSAVVKMKMKEFWEKAKPVLRTCWGYLKLMPLSFVLMKRNFVEYIKIVYYYYSNITFAKVDLSMMGAYVMNSPFKISREFLVARGETEVHAYGETPLTTMDQIAKAARLHEDDVVFELGCGRGRACFWLNSFIGCRVVGIDFVPTFIEKANKIKSDFKLDRIEFRQEDFVKADVGEATVIYLYGTCLDDDSITNLAKKFEKMPSGTKIITVSYPLTDYTEKDFLEVMRVFPAQFTWGTADVYLHLVR